MCYPKPGPRCSAHAAARVAKARQTCLIDIDKRRISDEHYSLYEKHRKALDKAEQEYSITPAGIRELERDLLTSPTSERTRQQLEEAKTLRAARLDAIKGDRTERKHNVKKLTDSIKYPHAFLSQDNADLYDIAEDDPRIETIIAESEAWTHKLTVEEMDTIRWYTQDGYSYINGNLSNPNYVPVMNDMDESRVKSSIKELDSALEKSKIDRDVIVYRRHFLYDDKGDFKDLTIEEQQDMFSKGSIYEPGFYMSTSLNPNNAPPSDGGFTVCFEIKARTAASLSVVANSGASEQEFLLPRTGKYRVVDNSKRINFHGKWQDDRKLTVIQLEEI